MKMRLITGMLTSVVIRSTEKESKENMTSLISKGQLKFLHSVLQIGVREEYSFHILGNTLISFFTTENGGVWKRSRGWIRWKTPGLGPNVGRRKRKSFKTFST